MGDDIEKVCQSIIAGSKRIKVTSENLMLMKREKCAAVQSNTPFKFETSIVKERPFERSRNIVIQTLERQTEACLLTLMCQMD